MRTGSLPSLTNTRTPGRRMYLLKGLLSLEFMEDTCDLLHKTYAGNASKIGDGKCSQKHSGPAYSQYVAIRIDQRLAYIQLKSVQ